VAVDCGKERCCLGGKYCSPYLFKYIPCNLKVSWIVMMNVVMVVNCDDDGGSDVVYDSGQFGW
jgi:hypothetical protein